MDLGLYLTFVAATAIMIFLPGPSVMLTVAHSLAFGWKRGLVTTAGATCGIAVQLAITLIGLASVMLLLAEWFEWIRWAGVAYLIYLGIKQWRAAPEIGEAAGLAVTDRSLFLQGLIVTIPNPKSLLFFAAFFPQFIDPGASLALQSAIIVPTFLVVTYLFTGVWALLAGHGGRFFRSRRHILLRNRISGGLMISAGLGLALARRG